MGFLNAINLILFGAPDIQLAAFPILPVIAGVSAAGGLLSSFLGQRQAKKAQEQARGDIQGGIERAEQVLSGGEAPNIMESTLLQQLKTPGLTPQELETMRFGQRRTLEDAIGAARQKTMQSMSQRGLLRSGIASRGMADVESARIRGIADIEQALAMQQIAQRRQDFMDAMKALLERRGQIANIYAGQGANLSNIALQGGLAQAAGTQALGGGLLKLSGTLLGDILANRTPASTATVPSGSSTQGGSFGGIPRNAGFNLGNYSF